MNKLISIGLIGCLFSVVVADDRYVKIDDSGVALIDKAPFWDAVEDKNTNLIWQNKSSSDIKEMLQWSSAIDACDDLVAANITNWRLPNKNELKSIIDYYRHSPVMDTTFFPSVYDANNLWTSTTVQDDADQAWYLDSKTGYVYFEEKQQSYGFICVAEGFSE